MTTPELSPDMEAVTRLSHGRRLGFGVGDFGLNIFWNMTNIFVLFYYTDVLGLPNAIAGYIVMGAMIWDAVTDPLIGYMASKTNTRFGRYRPYILVGAVPLAVSFALMFSNPGFEGASLIVYATATHLLFRTFYTVVGVPYSSLTARMTRSSDERGALAVYRIVFGAVAALLVAALTLEAARGLGAGDVEAGFGRIAGMYAALAAAAILFCFFVTHEDPALNTEEAAPRFSDIMRMLRANSAFWIAVSVVVLGMSGATVTGKALLYYLKYNLDAEELIGLTSAAIALMIILSVPVWGRMSQIIGKRNVWLSGMCFSITAALMLYFNPWETPMVVIPLLMFGAIGSGAGYFSVWATIPDTVEFGEWKTGVRAESVLFGAVSFAQKLSLGVAVGVVGMLLDAIGYRANEVQSPETLEGLRALISIVPMCFAILCVLLIANYRLDRKRHSEIVAEIARRGTTESGR